MNLRVDPAREGLHRETGIPVRARKNDRWVTSDIVDLDKESLLTWLRSRGGANDWAESVVLILLGHPR